MLAKAPHVNLCHPALKISHGCSLQHWLYGGRKSGDKKKKVSINDRPMKYIIVHPKQATDRVPLCESGKVRPLVEDLLQKGKLPPLPRVKQLDYGVPSPPPPSLPITHHPVLIAPVVHRGISAPRAQIC